MQIGVKQPRVRALLRRLLEAGLQAADPEAAVLRHVKRTGHLLTVGRQRYDLRNYDRVIAVGAGKASARMAAALEHLLGKRLTEGLVIVKYGHAIPTKIIRMLEAGHPIPDRAGQQATMQVRSLLGRLTSKDLLFVLLSGGASSLLPAPVPGVTLAEKRKTTALLLRCGASIQEANTVRKHLSTIKGGRLVSATKARIVSLILSDVLGDDLGTIGSGPTAPDPTTYAEACAILRRYRLWSKVPASVRAHLAKGLRGTEEETPKPGSALFKRVQNEIVGNNGAAVEAVAKAAKLAGLHPLILTTTLTGEAREAAKTFGALAREITSSDRPVARPACVIAGGELTVTLRGNGRGGRAQEFALAAALEIAGLPDVWVAGFGTDGTDGPTEVAGAVVDGQTVLRALTIGVDPSATLLRNDSYRFFTKLGGHLVAGPTGTNVNDFYLLIAL
ncbi:MAG: glycerate kinase [Nitrospirae bacterium]|nr:MAG: glycerate kinase [Nitrospirota bacterium]